MRNPSRTFRPTLLEKEGGAELHTLYRESDVIRCETKTNVFPRGRAYRATVPD
jgi:hypothetical protein